MENEKNIKPAFKFHGKLVKVQRSWGPGLGQLINQDVGYEHGIRQREMDQHIYDWIEDHKELPPIGTIFPGAGGFPHSSVAKIIDHFDSYEIQTDYVDLFTANNAGKPDNDKK